MMSSGPGLVSIATRRSFPPVGGVEWLGTRLVRQGDNRRGDKVLYYNFNDVM